MKAVLITANQDVVAGTLFDLRYQEVKNENQELVYWFCDHICVDPRNCYNCDLPLEPDCAWAEYCLLGNIIPFRNHTGDCPAGCQGYDE